MRSRGVKSVVIDATSSPQLHLLDGVEFPGHRRDVVAVTTYNLTHRLISTQPETKHTGLSGICAAKAWGV